MTPKDPLRVFAVDFVVASMMKHSQSPHFWLPDEHREKHFNGDPSANLARDTINMRHAIWIRQPFSNKQATEWQEQWVWWEHEAVHFVCTWWRTEHQEFRIACWTGIFSDVCLLKEQKNHHHHFILCEQAKYSCHLQSKWNGKKQARELVWPSSFR